MRATAKISKFIRGNVAHYGIENAEIRNAENEGKGFGRLCQRKLGYQWFYPFFLTGSNILSPPSCIVGASCNRASGILPS